MNDKKDNIKFKALESSVYCPPFKEESAIETIKLDCEFDVEKVKDEVRRSVPLLSYRVSYRPVMIEILDILDRNKAHFLVDKQKYISFYWSGILVCRIEVENEVNHNKQLHVSLQKYKTEKERYETEEKNNRLMKYGFGGAAAISALILGFTLFNKDS